MLTAAMVVIANGTVVVEGTLVVVPSGRSCDDWNLLNVPVALGVARRRSFTMLGVIVLFRSSRLYEDAVGKLQNRRFSQYPT